METMDRIDPAELLDTLESLDGNQAMELMGCRTIGRVLAQRIGWGLGLGSVAAVNASVNMARRYCEDLEDRLVGVDVRTDLPGIAGIAEAITAAVDLPKFEHWLAGLADELRDEVI